MPNFLTAMALVFQVMTEIGAALPRPIRIGLANLDTSHPLGYIPVIRALGHEVTGVYDDGVVFDTSYARRFVSENGLTRRLVGSGAGNGTHQRHRASSRPNQPRRR